MELGISARKRTPAGEMYEGTIAFGDAREEIGRLLAATAGKAVLLSDETAFPVFREAALSPRAAEVVFDGDCLPLFLMPDGISRVLAAGGGAVLRAARYFAGVRGLPCTLFPTDGTLDGTVGGAGEVEIGEKRVCVPLREVDLFCDYSLLSPLADAYARILLSRLADFEARALNAFGRSERVGETFLPPPEAEAIVRENARRRRSEETVWRGEGAVLAERLREAGDLLPAWTACTQLTALYAAFFEKGRPRRYLTPDYRKRAARAGTERTEVPAPEEYARRAICLERIRAAFAKEALALVAGREGAEERVRLLGGSPCASRDLTLLGRLPEYAPRGLSAIIRDFGLMEWDE